MIHTVITSILFLIIYFFSQEVRANDVIYATEEIQVIGEKILFLEDAKREFTIEEIWEKKRLDLLEKHDKKFFNKPHSSSSYWFAFTVQTELEDIWININNNNLDSIHFYLMNDSGKLIRETLTGSILNKNTREFYADTYWFRLIEKQDTSKKHVFLKVFSSMSIEVPIELGSFNNLLENKFINDLYAQVFIGGLLIMFLYNLMLYIILRDRVYLYYLTYIFGSIFASSFVNNYPIIELFVGQYFAHLYAATWMCICFVGVLLFTIEYLQLKKNSRFIYNLLIVYIVMLFVFSFIQLYFAPIDILNIYEFFIALVAVTCLISTYYLWFKGHKNARLYSIGWTVLMLSSLLYLLVTNGFLPYNSFTRNITYLGILMEIIIFSIALADRIVILKIEQENLNIALTRKNKELTQSNESLDLFNYHVSHDLKSVLNNTDILSKMIKKYLDKGETKKVSEIVSKLQIVAKNGIETVQSFLSLGKIDSLLANDSREIRDIEFSIGELIINHNLSDEINITIENKEKLYLYMHPKAFESIFLNLITNSIKYSKLFPEVSIRVFSVNKGIQILFKDNGIGIDLEKNRSKIFEPFVRFTNDMDVEGSGVGLFLVKKIVNSYNGSIDVNSQVGKGTTFVLFFN